MTLLRQIAVEIANGKTTPQACKVDETTQQTCYRGRCQGRLAVTVARASLVACRTSNLGAC